MTREELAAGMRVEWRHGSRRGCRPSWWVPATVVKVGESRVTIDADLTTGGTRRVSVTPERLRPAKRLPRSAWQPGDPVLY